MTTLSWTRENLETAFAIRNVNWNRIRVFLGPDAEDKATRFVVDAVLADLEPGCGVPHEQVWMNNPKSATQEQYDETHAWLEEHDHLDDWDILGEARVDTGEAND